MAIPQPKVSGVTPILTEKEIEIYPLTSTPPNVVSSGVWGWGSWTQIVPPNTITRDFIIVGVVIEIESLAAGRLFNIQLGVGAAGAESSIITVAGRYVVDTAAGRRLLSAYYPLPIPRKIDANSRISARASDDTGGLGYKVWIQYIELPL